MFIHTAAPTFKNAIFITYTRSHDILIAIYIVDKL